MNGDYSDNLTITTGDLGSAVFSKDELYRYDLTREWGDSSIVKNAVWIGLNPSTATADVDDPTIRRCINFSKAWGANQYVMLNLFAFRATDPKIMKAADDPVGPFNDEIITSWLLNPTTHFVVCAWGSHGKFKNRSNDVAALLRKYWGVAYCLGVTKNGEPRHPLYLSKEVRLLPWNKSHD